MNEVTALLAQSLGVFVMPILLVIRGIRKRFALDPDKPTIHEGLIALMMLISGFGLSYAQSTLNAGIPPASLLDMWWVQGFLFFGGIFLGDLGMDATSIKTASAERKLDAMPDPKP